MPAPRSAQRARELCCDGARPRLHMTYLRVGEGDESLAYPEQRMAYDPQDLSKAYLESNSRLHPYSMCGQRGEQGSGHHDARGTAPASNLCRRVGSDDVQAPRARPWTGASSDLRHHAESIGTRTARRPSSRRNKGQTAAAARAGLRSATLNPMSIPHAATRSHLSSAGSSPVRRRPYSLQLAKPPPRSSAS